MAAEIGSSVQMSDLTGAADSFRSTRRIGGFTHLFYRYPATTSPELVRALILRHSSPGDLVLDPFVGGGTTAVEAIAHGRRVVACDVNRIATLVTLAKTTPLWPADWACIEHWLDSIALTGDARADEAPTNLPANVYAPLAAGKLALDVLFDSRQKRLARCALLQVGQWALEGSRRPRGPYETLLRLRETVAKMRNGMDEFLGAARAHGLPAARISPARTVKCCPASAAATGTRHLHGMVRLVVTSPPYPGVHVLYHRWQIAGRRETSAPYWIAGVADGHGPAFYTMGGRSAAGRQRYFADLTHTFAAIRPILHPDALVFQTVAFPAPEAQLPTFAAAMVAAGYDPLDSPTGVVLAERTVPNRRWYARDRDLSCAREVLLGYRVASGAGPR